MTNRRAINKKSIVAGAAQHKARVAKMTWTNQVKEGEKNTERDHLLNCSGCTLWVQKVADTISKEGWRF